MKTRLLAALGALLLVGCDNSGMMVKHGVLNYSRDTRTGLCFATLSTGGVSPLTYVPCTPEVLKLIAQ